MCGGLEEKYDFNVYLIEFKSKRSGGGRASSVGRGVADSGWESGMRSLGADVGGGGAVGRGGVWRFEGGGGAFSLLLLLGGKELLGSCDWYEEGKDDGCELKDGASSGGIFGIGNS